MSEKKIRKETVKKRKKRFSKNKNYDSPISKIIYN